MMNLLSRVIAILLTALFVLPVVAYADREGGEERGKDGGSKNCSEHKGKMKCRGEKEHKRKHGGRESAGGPPPWAPAHGWRRHNGDGDSEYQVSEEDSQFIEEKSGARVVVSQGNATVDVGINSGTCNRKVIGTVLGGIVGGAIGNRVGDSQNRKITTIVGVVVGGLIGHKIGRSMDKVDQHCTGQALEQAPDHHTVRWSDSDRQGEYRVTPERTYQSDGVNCRDYITEYQGPAGIERDRSSACRTAEGAWQKRLM